MGEKAILVNERIAGQLAIRDSYSFLDVIAYNRADLDFSGVKIGPFGATIVLLEHRQLKRSEPAKVVLRWKIGQQMWVREPHEAPRQRMGLVRYKSNYIDRTDIKWRSGLALPRWASRTTLTVASIKVHRLGDLTKEDAYQYGFDRAPFDLFKASLYGKVNGFGKSIGTDWRDDFWVDDLLVYTTNFHIDHRNIDQKGLAA